MPCVFELYFVFTISVYYYPQQVTLGLVKGILESVASKDDPEVEKVRAELVREIT